MMKEEDRELARTQALREKLYRICQSEGPISFARYMELCLYDPEVGYYTASSSSSGPRGDYITYPAVHRAFGRCMGRQVVEIWELMGRRVPFFLVEVGGGRGELTRDMIGLFEEKRPELLGALKVILVDISSRLLDEQVSAISQSGVSYTAMGPEGFFFLSPFVGCLVSNELFDAMPVHVVEVREGSLREVFVEVGPEGVREVLGEPSNERIWGYLEALDARPVEGQRFEVGLAAVEWMEKLGKVLERGCVITVDFGYSGPDAFHPRRPQGTLMAYKGHKATPNVYELPGTQDLCSHVNFSALMWAGQKVGLKPLGLVPQDRFLINLGLIEEMGLHERRRDKLTPAQFWGEKLALRRLMMPQPIQGGFQVLVQVKGWEPQGLKGLASFLEPSELG